MKKRTNRRRQSGKQLAAEFTFKMPASAAKRLVRNARLLEIPQRFMLADFKKWSGQIVDDYAGQIHQQAEQWCYKGHADAERIANKLFKERPSIRQFTLNVDVGEPYTKEVVFKNPNWRDPLARQNKKGGRANVR